MAYPSGSLRLLPHLLRVIRLKLWQCIIDECERYPLVGHLNFAHIHHLKELRIAGRYVRHGEILCAIAGRWTVWWSHTTTGIRGMIVRFQIIRIALRFGHSCYRWAAIVMGISYGFGQLQIWGWCRMDAVAAQCLLQGYQIAAGRFAWYKCGWYAADRSA